MSETYDSGPGYTAAEHLRIAISTGLQLARGWVNEYLVMIGLRLEAKTTADAFLWSSCPRRPREDGRWVRVCGRLFRKAS